MISGIYCYIDKNINKIVYVGKDSHIDENRRHKAHLSSSHYNNQPFNRVLQNNPQRYQYKILKQGNFSDALLNALEIIYIKRYGTYDNRKGYGKSYGFNFTIGGDGSTGYRHTKETLQRMKDNAYDRRGENNPMYGKTGKDAPCYGRTGSKHPNYNHRYLKEDRIKMSRKTNNNTGYLNVYRKIDKSCSQGFLWAFQYYDLNKKRKMIRRVNLIKLKEAVLQKNLEWQVVDEEKAKRTCKKYGYNYEDLK